MKDDFEFLRGLANCQDKEQMARYIEEHQPKSMTNGDRIRAMSDEERVDCLIQFAELDCRIGFCLNLPECEKLLDTEDGIPSSMCKKCLLKWLQQPAEDL